MKRVWIPLAAVLAFELFGFLILPGILRGQVVQGIRTNLKREAKLARVRVNPIFLSLTLEGFDGARQAPAAQPRGARPVGSGGGCRGDPQRQVRGAGGREDGRRPQNGRIRIDLSLRD